MGVGLFTPLIKRGPQEAQHGPNIGPRWPHDGPKRAQDGPKMVQNRAQDGPNTATALLAQAVLAQSASAARAPRVRRAGALPFWSRAFIGQHGLATSFAIGANNQGIYSIVGICVASAAHTQGPRVSAILTHRTAFGYSWGREKATRLNEPC